MRECPETMVARPERRLPWLLLLLAAMAPGRAQAAPVHRLRVVAAGSCPDAASVVAQLRTLFPSLDAVPASDGATAEDALLVEQPDGLVVTLAGARRAFADPDGRCAERARFAAVFLAVTLYPPQIAAPPPVPRPEPAPAPLPSSADVELQVGPAFLAAPAAEQSTVPVAVGGGARLLVSPGGVAQRRLALTAGVSFLSSTLRDPRADAQALWIPVDLGGRLSASRARLEGAAELSLVVAPVRLRGQNVATVEEGWRVQAGARAALVGRVWLTHRIAAGITGFGYGWPTAVRLDVGGAGAVGHAPRLWLGGELSIAVRLQ